jgi:hypothetical protein
MRECREERNGEKGRLGSSRLDSDSPLPEESFRASSMVGEER